MTFETEFGIFYLLQVTMKLRDTWNTHVSYIDSFASILKKMEELFKFCRYSMSYL